MLEYYHSHIRKIIDGCRDIGQSNKSSIRKEVLDRHLLPNQFLTISYLKTNTFDEEYTRNVEQVLGYSIDEFTPQKIFEIVDPDHIVLALIYAMIAYSLLQIEEVIFNEDYCYWIECNMLNEKGDYVRIERSCWLLDFENGEPITQLDIWSRKALPRSSLPFVKYGFFTPNPKVETPIFYKLFYEKWSEWVGFSFSKRKEETLVLLKQGYRVKEIAEKMGIKSHTVNQYIKEMKLQVNGLITNEAKWGDDFIQNELKKLLSKQQQISSSIELLNFVEQFSLMNMNPHF